MNITSVVDSVKSKLMVGLLAAAACFLMVAANLAFASPSHAASNGTFNYTAISGSQVQIDSCVGGANSCPENLTIPNTINGSPVTKIAGSAFLGSTSIKSVVIGDNVADIGAYAFQGLSSLSSLNLGSAPKVLGQAAFKGSTALSNADLSSVTSMGQGVFNGASALQAVTLRSNLTSISQAAFKETSSLSSINIPGSVTSIGANAFLGSGLTSLTLPNSVSTLGTSAFERTTRLTSVTLGSGLAAIPDSAFLESGLTTLTIPDTVTSIGSYAFQNNSNLATVAIGRGASSINYQAFFNDAAITSLRFLGSAAPSLGANSFGNTGSATFYRMANANSWPSTIAAHAVVQVSPPSITSQPAAASVTSGEQVSLSVTADPHTGGGILGYQWRKNGTNIVGATSNAFSIPTGTTSDAGSYSVVITSWAGTVTSNSVTVSVTSGTSGSLVYDFVPGTPNSLTITGCVGGVGSCPASLVIPDTVTIAGTVVPVASIASQAFMGATSVTSLSLGNNLATIGSEAFKNNFSLATVTFGTRVSAIGANAFTGDTSLANVKFMGTTGPTLDATAFASSGSAGFFRVAGTGWNASANGHSISAVSAPMITTNPSSASVSDGTSVSLSVVADAQANGGTLTYQWFKNNVLVGGATSSTLNLGPVTGTNDKPGIYTVVVTGWAGSATSSPATVAVTGGTSGSFTYKFGADNTVIITGCVGGASSCPSALVIPATINISGTDYPVTLIDTNAFLGSTSITSVSIGSNVTTIGLGAFRFITGITSVTIPNNVRTIGVSAFGDDTNLASLDLGNGVTTIGTSAFSSTKLSSLTIPNSVSTIAGGAFIANSHLTTLVLGTGVTTIEQSAFTSCPLASVRFTSANGPTMGLDAFGQSSVTLFRPAGGSNWPAATDNHPIVVSTGPTVTAQPESHVVARGGAVTLTVGADGNGSGVTYQWKKDGTSIGGATAATYAVDPVTASTVGDYTVTVTNWAGNVASEAAAVSLAVGQQGDVAYAVVAGTPHDKAAITGCAATCPAVVTIPSVVNYNGTNLDVASVDAGAFDGASAITTVRFNATDSISFGAGAFANTGSGDFYRLAGGSGWAGSVGGHTIVPVSAPSITTQPADASVAIGAPLHLAVVVDGHNGGGDLIYQWTKDGIAIDGATNATYDVGSFTADDVGTYLVSISGWAGGTDSRAATVAIGVPTPSPSTGTTPPPAAAKSNQTLTVTLPTTLKKKATYKLSASTKQGTKVLWKLPKNKFCSLKGVSLKCTKASGKQLITLTAQAPGSSTLNPFSTTIKRKVK